MTKTKGSNSIQPEQRLNWLKRFEDGESIFKISVEADIDYRTVKKHIGIARNEKELRDERSIVLRGALERHFSDLAKIVDLMLTDLDMGYAIELTGDDEFLQSALREHIPRSVIWNLIRKWNSSVNSIFDMETRIREQFESKIFSETTLATVNKSKNDELFIRIRSALKPEGKNISHSGLDIKVLIEKEKAKLIIATKNVIAAFDILNEKELDVFKKILMKIQKEMETWEEFAEMEIQYGKLVDTYNKLKEQLRIMKWKRIVPGRCRLCPM